jgi:hypothetical protein
MRDNTRAFQSNSSLLMPSWLQFSFISDASKLCDHRSHETLQQLFEECCS